MRKLFASVACCLLLGLSLFAGCGGGGSTIQSLPTPSPPPHSPPPTSSLTLANPPPPPPQGNVGQPMGIDPASWTVGGVHPITVSLKSGTLPAGLTMSPPGVFGIPTAVSSTTVVFTVTDSETPPGSVNVSIPITINPMLPLAISPGSGALPGGTVGVRYNGHCDHAYIRCHWRYGFLVSATGGVVYYMFSAASGSSLPPGMSFTGSGGFYSIIDGTPTTAGTYNFVGTVTDSESPPKQVSANYTITVAPAPTPSPSP